MIARHTPGPWLTVRDNFIGVELLSRHRLPQGMRIVWQRSFGDLAYVLPADSDNGNANARLIAAAPTLLTALKEIRELVGQRPGERSLRIARIAAAAIGAASNAVCEPAREEARTDHERAA
jgi:hypothetical protein